LTSPVLIAPVARLTITRSPRSRSEPLLFYATVGLLLFGPLAFGAVEPWAVFMLEAGAAVIFVCWAMGQAASHQLQITGNALFAPASTFVLLIGLQLWTGQTVYPAQTFSAALLYLAYGAICFLVLQVVRANAHFARLAWILSGYGLVVAIFSLAQGFTSEGKVYWLVAPHFGGWIYGPYVNHNHYAGLMEMLVPIPLVILLLPHLPPSRKAMAGLAASVMASTIFLCGSRGGMIAFAMQIVLLTSLCITRKATRKTALALASFVLIAFGLALWLGGREVAQRLATVHRATGLSSNTRLNIDRDALKMFLQKPLLGYGLGNFAEVYPQFRSFSTDLWVDHAHNDYLELLVETGALGFATMLWFLVVLGRLAIRKLKSWPHDPDAAITLAPVLGATGILLHSFVDFNLHIPANAALFYVLCVVATRNRSSAFDH